MGSLLALKSNSQTSLVAEALLYLPPAHPLIQQQPPSMFPFHTPTESPLLFKQISHSLYHDSFSLLESAA